MPSLDLPIELIARPLSLNPEYSPASVFAPYANTPWSFWLDSNESDHQDSRFDILVTEPVLTLETTGSFNGKAQAQEVTTEVIAHHASYQKFAGQLNGDPLAHLKRLEQQVFKSFSLPECDLPFKVGAVGYFSYDLGRCFEQLPTQAADDIQLPLMAVGIYTQALIYDRNTKTWFLIAPQANWQQQADSITTQTEIQHQAEQATTASHARNFSLTSRWQANISEAEYQQKFAQVQDYLHAGDCYQINLAQRFSASYRGDEFAAYLTLREANQAPFSAFLRLADHTILSISPERFLQLTNDQVQTKPIKGTVPRGVRPEEDNANAERLSQSTKDRAENLMIVDLLRNDLSRVCVPGSVKVPKLFDIESFPAVHHLVSTVEGQLAPGYDGTDLLRASFPGGSITGAPKIRAMEIIEELEPQRRNLYCGSIGYLSACGNMDTSITIRTLICQDSQVYCWAGGGLVADSKVASEYQETFDKVRKILPVLAS